MYIDVCSILLSFYTGFGESIDTAVEAATHDCLKRLFQITESSSPLPFGKEAKNITLKDETNLSLEEWSVGKAQNIVTC